MTGTPPPATCCGSATVPASPMAPMSSISPASKNPIGLKCGPSLETEDLKQLLPKSSIPKREAGRLNAHHPVRRRQGARSPAAPDRNGRSRRASRSSGAATRCTANTVKTDERLQDAPIRIRAERGRGFLRGAPRDGHLCRRRSYRDDRPRRDRMHRRRFGGDRERSVQPLRHPLRSASQRFPGARTQSFLVASAASPRMPGRGRATD